MSGLTLRQLSEKAGVSPSHIGRIERGERFPSARILKKIAQPLGFQEEALLVYAEYLSPSASEDDSEKHFGNTVIGILSILKSVAGGLSGE